MPVVQSIVRDSAGQHYRFSSLVAGIVKSAPFQMRMTQGDAVMFITKKHCPAARSSQQCRRDDRPAVSRRDGAGADAAGQTAASADAALRLHLRAARSIMKDWTPAQEGAGFEFSPILKPLERFRDQLKVLTDLPTTARTATRRARRCG